LSIDFGEYGKALHASKFPPNFYVSREYFCAAGWEIRREGPWLAVRDKEDGALMLPRLSPEGDADYTVSEPLWSDFPGFIGLAANLSPPSRMDAAFHSVVSPRTYRYARASLLNHNYIYIPERFADLAGSHFKTLRKNLRNFDRLHPGAEYRPCSVEDCLCAIDGWAGSRETILDGDTILHYAEDSVPDRRFGLWDGATLLGVNLWDSNYAFLNFRYCFVADPSAPFVSEALRFRFYTINAQPTGKWVNDGGDLGLESLRRFKQKLAPANRVAIHSWEVSCSTNGAK